MKIIRHFFILLFLLNINAIQAQSASEELDNFFKRIEQRNLAMGSVSISKKGKIVYHNSFGYSSFSPAVKADTSTTYLIGSISKLLTATIILQNVDEGKISFNDKLEKFFPELPGASEITVEHLLNHRSGIHNFGADRSKKYRDVNPQTREEILEVFRNEKLDFAPGKKFEYNNANYLLLSLIAEEIDDTTFATILASRITAPLKMKNTFLSTDSLSAAAQSFYWQGKWLPVPKGDPSHILGAGAIASSTVDMNLFLHALFQNHFFPQELLNKMITVTGGAGLGIFKYPFYSRNCYGHGGSIAAFESIAIYFPEDEVAVSIFLNAERMQLNDILKETLEIYFNTK